jgi:TonB family protein
MRGPLVVLIVLAPLHQSASAQSSCSFDTAARIRPVTVILGIAAGTRDISRELLADYISAAEAIREQFSRPATLTLPFAARVVTGKKSDRTGMSHAPYGLDGFIRFQIDSTGRLTNAPIVVSSASPEIVDGILASIQRADSNYAFPPPSKKLRQQNGEITLRFVDTVATKERSVALLRLIVPAIRADHDPIVLDFPPMGYPPDMLRLGMSGRVMLEFIIRTDSTMDQSSLQVLESPHRDFATRALQGLTVAHYRPAKIGNCFVPALVRLPVDFKIRRADITGEVRSFPVP